MRHKYLFKPGMMVAHRKMQVLGKIKSVEKPLLQIEVDSHKPLQLWKFQDAMVWDGKEEMGRQLRRGGYIRDLFLKM